MPRRKRSEKRATTAPAPVREPRERAGTEVISALCPICGKGIPATRALKVAGTTVGSTAFYDSVDWVPDKQFGMAMEASGRGSFRNWRPIAPEEAPELFEAVRKRFIDAISEWLAKGWLTAEQVEAAIASRQPKSK